MTANPSASRQDVRIPAPGAELPGFLDLPPAPRGVVAFAHGSGSSRHSSRNQLVASVLHRRDFGTLLFDLLTEAEATDRHNVFDIELLAGRLLCAARWLLSSPETAALPIGLFGASTGAAATLIAASREERVHAIVSRGGRPDLAARRLEEVQAPTLLIVGGEDAPVLELNRQAFGALRCEKGLEVIDGASHLFEESGTLERAADLAAAWFARHLGRGRPP